MGHESSFMSSTSTFQYLMLQSKAYNKRAVPRESMHLSILGIGYEWRMVIA